MFKEIYKEIEARSEAIELLKRGQDVVLGNVDSWVAVENVVKYLQKTEYALYQVVNVFGIEYDTLVH